MKNRIDTKGLLMHYLLRRDGEASDEIVSYCLNEIESGRGKRALKGRLVFISTPKGKDGKFYDLATKSLATMSGRGKRALKGRLEIKVGHINFNNWNDYFYDLQKALYND